VILSRKMPRHHNILTILFSEATPSAKANMKAKILLTISILMVFGLTIAAYAYTTIASTKIGTSCCCKNAEAQKDAASCCAKDSCCKSADSCPMKKDTASKDAASCCAKDDCCCKGEGDSCPIKGKKDEGHSGEKHTPSCCEKKESPKKDG
jgi:hypothetical protein